MLKECHACETRKALVATALQNMALVVCAPDAFLGDVFGDDDDDKALVRHQPVLRSHRLDALALVEHPPPIELARSWMDVVTLV